MCVISVVCLCVCDICGVSISMHACDIHVSMTDYAFLMLSLCIVELSVSVGKEFLEF